MRYVAMDAQGLLAPHAEWLQWYASEIPILGIVPPIAASEAEGRTDLPPLLAIRVAF
jgi:hypothetical protein